MTTKQISLPVLRVAVPRRGATGELAGLTDAAAAAAKKKLTSLSISDDALHTAVQAVATTAASIDKAVPPNLPFALRSFEVSLGVTASGSVAILGTGVDVECEATFTLTFERTTKE